jgi:transcriptional regulator with XRE-family HTH domain
MQRVITAPVPNLRAYRLHATLTQVDLGRLSGSNNANISMWETGFRDPSFRVIRRLAAALGVTPEDLRFGKPKFEDGSLANESGE